MSGCPCGRGLPYDACCGPFLAGAPAPTPEALMRSRYTAFVRGDTAHLLRTWHPRTRPQTLALDPDRRWLRLEVVSATGGLLDAEGTVHFRAHHDAGVQEEVSAFVREAGAWTYLR